MRVPALPPRAESVLILGGLAAFALLPAVPGVPLCPVLLITGNECPTCGITRALFELMHGHPGAAALLNPAVFILVIVVLRRLLLLNLPETSRTAAMLSAAPLDRGLLASFFAMALAHGALR